jgi:predicted NBD/HSP70 family sugar kinase
VVQTVTALRIGVDIGGTFTDLCVLDESGVVAVGKVLTTHDEPARAVESVLVDTLREAGLSTVDVERFVHGITLVTNAPRPNGHRRRSGTRLPRSRLFPWRQHDFDRRRRTRGHPGADR